VDPKVAKSLSNAKYKAKKKADQAKERLDENTFEDCDLNHVQQKGKSK
jgi:hypothetical protein